MKKGNEKKYIPTVTYDDVAMHTMLLISWWPIYYPLSFQVIKKHMFYVEVKWGEFLDPLSFSSSRLFTKQKKSLDVVPGAH